MSSHQVEPNWMVCHLILRKLQSETAFQDCLVCDSVVLQVKTQQMGGILLNDDENKEDQLRASVTHLVTEKRGRSNPTHAKRTTKYFAAVLRGSWIVTRDCASGWRFVARFASTARCVPDSANVPDAAGRAGCFGGEVGLGRGGKLSFGRRLQMCRCPNQGPPRKKDQRVCHNSDGTALLALPAQPNQTAECLGRCRHRDSSQTVGSAFTASSARRHKTNCGSLHKS